MNAYDEDGAVVVDLVRHPKMFATHLTGPDEGARCWNAGASTLPAARSSPTAGRRPQEFPRVDERTWAPKPLRLQRRTHERREDEADSPWMATHQARPRHRASEVGRSKAVRRGVFVRRARRR